MINQKIAVPYFLAAALFFLTAPALPATETAVTIDRIVAIVNGEAITLSEMNDAVRQARIGLLGFTLDSEKLGDPQFERDILTRLIDKKIQLQMARRAGIVVGPEEIDRAVQDVKKVNGLSSEQDLIAALEKEGLTEKEYKENIREQILIIKLINREVRSSVVLGTHELKDYYELNPTLFLQPGGFHLRQILFDKGDEEETTRTATRVKAELDRGEDFEALVHQHSIGPNAREGGDLGFIRQDLMQAQIRDAVENLEPGQISEVVKTRAGLHIFRLENKTLENLKPFEEVRNEVRERLYRERTEIKFEKWLRHNRTSSHVEVKY